jgi:NADH:ubiquinone oxidoreductase subunit F (NADH-binding)
VHFDLEVFKSAPAAICGEESALLEAIEGKRGEPRNKPPFPALQGLWQKPTVINNVETFAFATAILARGADWYKAQGVNGAGSIHRRERPCARQSSDRWASRTRF